MYILNHRKATGFSFIVVLITKISNIHESLKDSIKNLPPIRSWPYLIHTNIYSFHFLDYFEENVPDIILKILICNSKKWVFKKNTHYTHITPASEVPKNTHRFYGLLHWHTGLSKYTHGYDWLQWKDKMQNQQRERELWVKSRGNQTQLPRVLSQWSHTECAQSVNNDL